MIVVEMDDGIFSMSVDIRGGGGGLPRDQGRLDFGEQHFDRDGAMRRRQGRGAQGARINKTLYLASCWYARYASRNPNAKPKQSEASVWRVQRK